MVFAMGLFLAACGGKDEITVEPEPTPGPETPVTPVEPGEVLKLQLSAGTSEGAEWAVPSEVRVYAEKGDGHTLQLNAGLKIVSAVSPKQSFFHRYNHGSALAVKTTQPLHLVPVRGHIFTRMGVISRHYIGRQTCFFHLSA